MDALATGAILALMIRGPVNIGQLVKIARRTFVVACVVVACLFVWRLGLDALDPVFQILGFPALACGFAALIALAVLDSAGRLAAIFSHPALRFWGKYSYGLYVVHRAVGNPLTAWIDPNRIPLWLGSQFPRVLLLMIVNTAATLTVAMASWHFYEKHFLKLKDRFSHGVQQRATFRYR
jgi:peptidoglycan/LPS O-acetylase OafA/YrhL